MENNCKLPSLPINPSGGSRASKHNAVVVDLLDSDKDEDQEDGDVVIIQRSLSRSAQARATGTGATGVIDLTAEDEETGEGVRERRRLALLRNGAEKRRRERGKEKETATGATGGAGLDEGIAGLEVEAGEAIVAAEANGAGRVRRRPGGGSRGAVLAQGETADTSIAARARSRPRRERERNGQEVQGRRLTLAPRHRASSRNRQTPGNENGTRSTQKRIRRRGPLISVGPGESIDLTGDDGDVDPVLAPNVSSFAASSSAARAAVPALASRRYNSTKPFVYAPIVMVTPLPIPSPAHWGKANPHLLPAPLVSGSDSKRDTRSVRPVVGGENGEDEDDVDGVVRNEDEDTDFGPCLTKASPTASRNPLGQAFKVIPVPVREVTKSPTPVLHDDVEGGIVEAEPKNTRDSEQEGKTGSSLPMIKQSPGKIAGYESEPEGVVDEAGVDQHAEENHFAEESLFVEEVQFAEDIQAEQEIEADEVLQPAQETACAGESGPTEEIEATREYQVAKEKQPAEDVSRPASTRHVDLPVTPDLGDESEDLKRENSLSGLAAQIKMLLEPSTRSQGPPGHILRKLRATLGRKCSHQSPDTSGDLEREKRELKITVEKWLEFLPHRQGPAYDIFSELLVTLERKDSHRPPDMGVVAEVAPTSSKKSGRESLEPVSDEQRQIPIPEGSPQAAEILLIAQVVKTLIKAALDHQSPPVGNDFRASAQREIPAPLSNVTEKSDVNVEAESVMNFSDARGGVSFRPSTDRQSLTAEGNSRGTQKSGTPKGRESPKPTRDRQVPSVESKLQASLQLEISRPPFEVAEENHEALEVENEPNSSIPQGKESPRSTRDKQILASGSNLRGSVQQEVSRPVSNVVAESNVDSAEEDTLESSDSQGEESPELVRLTWNEITQSKSRGSSGRDSGQPPIKPNNRSKSTTNGETEGVENAHEALRRSKRKLRGDSPVTDNSDSHQDENLQQKKVRPGESPTCRKPVRKFVQLEEMIITLKECQETMREDNRERTYWALHDTKTGIEDALPSQFDEETDPFASLTSVLHTPGELVPEGCELETAHHWAFDKKGKVTRKKENYVTTSFRDDTPLVPRYQSYINIKYNILTADDENLKCKPWMGDHADEKHIQEVMKELNEQYINFRKEDIGTFERATKLRPWLDSWLETMNIGLDAPKLKHYVLTRDNIHKSLRLEKRDVGLLQDYASYELPESTMETASKFYEAFSNVFKLPLERVVLPKNQLKDMMDVAVSNRKQLCPDLTTKKIDVPHRLGTACQMTCLICGIVDCPTHGDFAYEGGSESSCDEDQSDPESPKPAKQGRNLFRQHQHTEFALLWKETIARFRDQKLTRPNEPPLDDVGPCGKDCYMLDGNGIRAHHFRLDESVADTIRDMMIAIYDPKYTSCLIAFAIDMPCWQVYTEVSQNSEDDICPPIPQNKKRGKKPDWYDNKKKTLKGNWEDMTRAHIHEERISSMVVRCDHEGPCITTCDCVRRNVLCERFCGCSDNCPRKFTGCACHALGKTCVSEQCICIAMNRECGPECISCGAIERMNPANKDHDEIFDSGCQNVSLQRGVFKSLVIGESQLEGAGLGLYTVEYICKGEFLSEYTGEVITHAEAERRGILYDRRFISFLFDLNASYVIDAARWGNRTRFINHAGKIEHGMNCKAKIVLVNGEHRIKFIALRDIREGEELLFDYGANFAKKHGLDAKLPLSARTGHASGIGSELLNEREEEGVSGTTVGKKTRGRPKGALGGGEGTTRKAASKNAPKDGKESFNQFDKDVEMDADPPESSQVQPPLDDSDDEDYGGEGGVSGNGEEVVDSDEEEDGEGDELVEESESDEDEDGDSVTDAPKTRRSMRQMSSTKKPKRYDTR